MRLDLIFSVRVIYIISNLSPLAKFTSSSRSTKLKDILPRNISNDHEDHPNQRENSHKLCNKAKYPVVNFMESQWKLRQQHDQNFPMEGIPLINKSKRAGLDPSRKVNHLGKVISDRKIITEFTRSINSTRIGKPALMMDVKVSKDKNISR